MGEDVDSLLQIAILRLEQGRIFRLKGAVGVPVLAKVIDHRKLHTKHHLS